MDSANGETTRQLLGHSGYVNSVAWSPNGKYVVSGGQGVCNDELVTIWDAETGMEILTFTGPKRNLPQIKKGLNYPVPECVSVAWSPDGTKLAYAVKIHHRKTDQLKGNNISVNEQGEYATEHYIQVWDFPHDGATATSNPSQTGSSTGSESTKNPAPAPTPKITPESLKEGLLAYYPLDLAKGGTNLNIEDKSGNDFNATSKEIVETGPDRHGRPNSACYFDGELGYIHCPLAVQKDTGSAGTISLWVNRLGASGSGYIFAGLSGGPSNRRYINIGNKNISCTVDRIHMKGDITTNQWHHILLTWRNNNSDAELFIDGKSVAKNNAKYWLEASAGLTPEIGGSFNQRTKMALDDFRIYRRGFSPQEVKALYNVERNKP